MDIFAHILWANASAKGLNSVFENEIKEEKPKKKFYINPSWAGFWGVFPDFFAFTIPFLIGIYNLIFIEGYVGSFRDHPQNLGGFDLASFLYQYSHSVVVWLFVFLVVWFFYKKPKYELLGWLLHILIDIPTHSIEFYPTPFLFPISEYRFPYGISWGTPWFMILNYSLLFIVFGGILFKKYFYKKL